MRYQALPVIVDAFEIEEVLPGPEAVRKDCASGVQCRLSSGLTLIATAEMLARYSPVVGDYWVVQADGYAYINPLDVFLRKYEHIAAEAPRHSREFPHT
jgi:hypothetical protein